MAPKVATSMSNRYDQALRCTRLSNFPPGTIRPLPTRFWPPENVALLERFADWLSGGGASPYTIRIIYIPMAGHVLGLALKPYSQFDLEQDLKPALDYVIAKRPSQELIKVCRNALARFRRFLLHERNQIEIKRRPFRPEPYTAGMPGWLVEELTRFQHVQERNWRPARLQENISRFWNAHLQIWRFLCERWNVHDLSDVRCKQIFDFLDQRLSDGASVSTINNVLYSFQGFLTFLQTEDIPIPRALLRIPGLKKPERLPQYLTDEQVRALSMDFENRLLRAIHPHQRRDANLDRAVFYLLWQGAMRKSEVEELRLEDLDLSHRRLTVRNGKGMVDRTVYLSDTVIRSLVTYLAVRGIGPTSHVFLYRNQPLCKDLVHTRMKAAGERVGVKLHAHRLRHTCATQLLNSGCPVTSIQKIMGHKELNTTMIYARAYDATVEADYFAAMDRVEQRLQLAGIPVTKEEPVGEEERSRLRTLAEQLFMPEMSFETRRNLALQMCSLLEMHAPVSLDWLPPPVLVKSTID